MRLQQSPALTVDLGLHKVSGPNTPIDDLASFIHKETMVISNVKKAYVSRSASFTIRTFVVNHSHNSFTPQAINVAGSIARSSSMLSLRPA